MGSSRQEYWSGVLLPSPRTLNSGFLLPPEWDMILLTQCGSLAYLFPRLTSSHSLFLSRSSYAEWLLPLHIQCWLLTFDFKIVFISVFHLVIHHFHLSWLIPFSSLKLVWEYIFTKKTLTTLLWVPCPSFGSYHNALSCQNAFLKIDNIGKWVRSPQYKKILKTWISPINAS